MLAASAESVPLLVSTCPPPPAPIEPSTDDAHTRDADPAPVPGSTNASSRNSANGHNSAISKIPTPASRPPNPCGLASVDTPITNTSASAGFITIAAMIQRSDRQNHDTVVCATNPAAVTGIVATRTRMAPSRNTISSM